ncbi:vascular endothelial growth factor receptor 1-like [Anopheles albimanus]|uniref:vascular endothelial growth factor receptor 1-like n=1 Tax=Anopheles albimanus TaxID=7167 RepID=UPI00163F54B4|nr:vascular endothelial growth factor receptor 1-like [Anopheles albimanus]
MAIILLYFMQGQRMRTTLWRFLFMINLTWKLHNRYAFKGKTTEFQCSSDAYPLAKVSFMFQQCKEVPWGNCSKVNDTASAWVEGRMINRFGWRTHAFYNVVADEPGIVHCKASNSEGVAITQAYLLLQNSSSLMALTISQPKVLITVGDNVSFICSVITFISGVDIRFELNGKVQNHSVIYKDSNTQRKEFTLWNVDRKDAGDVDCYIRHQYFPSFNEKRSIHIEVQNATAPILRSGKIDQTLVVNVFDTIILECDVAGAPEPKISWLKNGAPFAYNMSNPRNTSAVTIEYANPMHSGLYKCIAENKKGSITISRNVTVQNPSGNFNLPILYGTATFLILLITGLLLTSLIFYKKMKQAHNFRKFAENYFESHNSDIVLNDPANLLPYNMRYEFPKERLKLHTQLGIGAFGVVMKATATGIKLHEETTTVAVKIVKDKHDGDSMRALESELKILTHLGRHLNVVNLLGAVTQNIKNRKSLNVT